MTIEIHGSRLGWAVEIVSQSGARRIVGWYRLRTDAELRAAGILAAMEVRT